MPSNPRNQTRFRNQSELHLIAELNHSSASSLESWVLGPACVLFAFRVGDNLCVREGPPTFAHLVVVNLAQHHASWAACRRSGEPLAPAAMGFIAGNS